MSLLEAIAISFSIQAFKSEKSEIVERAISMYRERAIQKRSNEPNIKMKLRD